MSICRFIEIVINFVSHGLVLLYFDLGSDVFDTFEYGIEYRTDSELTYDTAKKSKPVICFGSFQDYLGTDLFGCIKAKNEWVHSTHWDLVIFDEYHFGAWRDNAKKLFEQEDEVA